MRIPRPIWVTRFRLLFSSTTTGKSCAVKPPRTTPALARVFPGLPDAATGAASKRAETPAATQPSHRDEPDTVTSILRRRMTRPPLRGASPPASRAAARMWTNPPALPGRDAPLPVRTRTRARRCGLLVGVAEDVLGDPGERPQP